MNDTREEVTAKEPESTGSRKKIPIPIKVFLGALLSGLLFFVLGLVTGKFMLGVASPLAALAVLTVYFFYWLFKGINSIVRYNDESPSVRDLILTCLLTGFAVVFMSLFAPGYFSSTAEGRIEGCEKNLGIIARSLESYYRDHNEKYPESLGNLVPEYMENIPACPQAGRDTYSSSYGCSDDRRHYTICCHGENHRWNPNLPGGDWPLYSSSKGLIKMTDFIDIVVPVGPRD